MSDTLQSYTIEAEDLHLNGYTAKYNSSDASGGGYVETWGTGTASTAFGGAAGTYSFDLSVFDENDGQSSINVYVNGQLVGTVVMDRDLNGNYIHGTLTTYTLDGIELQPGDELVFEGISESGEAARLDSIKLINMGPIAATESRVTLLHEGFGGIDWGNVTGNDFSVQNGQAVTNGSNDGALVFRTLDLSGKQNVRLTLDVATIGNNFEGIEHSNGDFLRLEIVDENGQITVLDVFEGYGDTLVGTNTGQTIDAGSEQISYDLPEGLGSVQIRLVSSISADDEIIQIDNVNVTAEQELAAISVDALDDVITVTESEGAGVLGDTLGDGPGSTGGGYDRVYAQSVYNGNHSFSTDAFYLGNDIPVLDDANRNAITGVSFSQDGEGTDRTFGLDELTFTGAQRSFVGLVTVQNVDVHNANDQFSSSISGGFQDVSVVSSGTADFTMNDGQVFQGIRVNFVRGPDGETYMMPDDGPSPYAFNAFRNMLATNDSGIDSFTIATGSGDDAGINPIEGNWADGQFFELTEGDDTIVVDAVDDSITVFESEGAGDLETLDDGSGSILDNDTENGVDYTGAVIEVNGQTGNVGEFITLAGGGRVKVNADGTVDFDAAGDFDALNDGQSDMVSVDYTIKSAEQAAKPQNVLLVIDISNSTVGLDGQNIFDGTGVGDVNNDGRADTVLDAQIVAAKALVDDLRSQGIDPALVNVGIVTFSGVDTTGASSYNDATTDSAVVGTFNLADAGIEAALDGILSGSWTNYEAGLSEAETWFGDNAQAGDNNTMYFLSDGRPITSFENGAYVEQDRSQFLDEVARIESGFGAKIHAIGVGSNSSLDALDQIDNTGGAIQVTDAAALTAALLETSELIEVQDSATVTIKVLGENEVVTIDAVDDSITVFESEGAGDLETLDDGSGSILDNDTENGVDYTGAVIEVNGQTGNVGEFITLAGGGRVKVNADGTVDFDAAGDFDALNDGQSDMVSVDYTIKSAEQAAKPQNVLLVIDISNSTVGLDGQNIFDGTGVGDVNNDGRADTVLDAQIVAAKALVDDLRSQGIDPALVNVGIVTFSGVDTTGASSYNDATTDSAVVGTFNLADAGIEAALDGILSGSWTNYEAGLSEAETWFGDNAQAGDNNTMYFLSDGRPITSFENGAYVEQDRSQFLDEVARIESGFGAKIHAIGVGSNSSLDALDQIDNTGGAIQVTDAAALTAALLETSELIEVQDSATVTIKVLGENEVVTIDAVDDSITVFESEGAGDLETLDDGSGSILDNDTENGVDYTGAVIEVNGQTGNVGEFITLAGGGRVKVNADGTVDFDAAGDFDALNDGQSDMVSVDYTIKSAEQAAKPQNVLLVIDISNSTVGLDGQNIFDGTGVGDVNNDGRADTVLDAQIVAAKALVDDLRSQGIDPALVNVGIVTFSGVDTTGASSYNDATTDSAVVGTFNLADAGIEAALDGILSGSWTNYEAGLSEAETWFGDNAQAGDNNTMYFLSDGRPITSFENGAYVEQDRSQFLDEVARIESGFGAKIHAIGVGSNSSLDALDQIDNTGGAIQVTDAAALTAALLETSELIEVQDSATVTIKVLGENEVVTIDAVDDLIIVNEDETFGDTETLEGGAGSILDNDTEGDQPYTGLVVEIEDQSANVGEFITLAGGGRVKVNADGTVDFDADGNGDGTTDFEALGNGGQAEVSFDYTISRPGGATTSIRTVDFEGLSRGTVVSTQIDGLTISAQRPGQSATSPNDAMIFDSSNPTGDDNDLGTATQGNLLIISEDNDSSDPDDSANGGTINIDLDTPATVEGMTFVDTEEGGATIVFTQEDGSTVTVTGPQTLDGGVGIFTAGVSNVVSMQISLIGSGAIDDIVLTETVAAPEVVDTATVVVKINGFNELADGDEIETVGEDSGLTTFSVGALDNTVDPESGSPVVTGVTNGTDSVAAGSQIAGNNGGLFTINSDGTVSFDTNGDFEVLDTGQSSSTTVTYTVEDAAGDTVTSTHTVIVNGADEPLGSISGKVFEDINEDGVSTGETAPEEVEITVRLLDADTGTQVATQTFNTFNNPDAAYNFDDLEAGNYKVEFQIDGFEFTEQDVNANADDAIDSDVDESGLSAAVAINGNDAVVDAGVLAPVAQTFRLKGNVENTVAGSRSITFIVDFSAATFGTQADPVALGDVNGDGSFTLIDSIISRIVEDVDTLPADQNLHFVLSGVDSDEDDRGTPDGIVAEFDLSAGQIQAAAAAADPVAALQQLFGPDVNTAFRQTTGQETELDIALALEAAKNHVISQAADVDEIIVLTSTLSADVAASVMVDDTDADPTNDSSLDLNGDSLVTPGITDPTAVVDELGALGADIDVVLIKPDQFAITDVLGAVDPDLITTNNVGTPFDPPDVFGLDDLIATPADVEVDVLSLSIGGFEFANTDTDTSNGVDFNIDGLSIDPSSVDVFVNVDRDGDGVADEQIAVTPVLVGDTFEFNLDIV